MAKRFISTELFDDEWFCDLSMNGKLFFIYYITKCDHAGVLRLNKRLCEFQTGIKSLETVTQELGNCLVSVRKDLYFMPNYLKFQYPDFPKSNVKQQDSAIKILKGLNLWDERKNNCYLTVQQRLDNSYVNENVHINENVIDNETDNGVPDSCENETQQNINIDSDHLPF